MKYIYVDNSNLFLGGCSLAAAKLGGTYPVHKVTDEQRISAKWNMDYVSLYALLNGGDESSVKFAKLWGSEPPSAPFWLGVENAGFQAEHWARNSQNKEKGIDTAIALEMGMDSGSINKDSDEIIVVSGDEDIIKAAEQMRAKGFKVTIYAWEHTVSKQLKDDRLVYTDLTPYFDQITRQP